MATFKLCLWGCLGEADDNPWTLYHAMELSVYLQQKNKQNKNRKRVGNVAITAGHGFFVGDVTSEMRIPTLKNNVILGR